MSPWKISSLQELLDAQCNPECPGDIGPKSDKDLEKRQIEHLAKRHRIKVAKVNKTWYVLD